MAAARKLPLVDPEKLTVPTIVMRGQWDGIAGFDDRLATGLPGHPVRLVVPFSAGAHS